MRLTQYSIEDQSILFADRMNGCRRVNTFKKNSEGNDPTWVEIKD
jgi:hypothetical protein